MFKKIIVASELSRISSDMIGCIARLKELGAEECLLLHCLAPEENDRRITSFFAEIYRENLNAQRDILLREGFKVETRMAAGSINEEITRIAESEDFSLIVIGPNEYSLTENLFLSNTEQINVHHPGKPVLIINMPRKKAGTPGEDSTCGIKDHILFPTDFSANAALAFEFVKKLAAYGAKKITVAHVQDESRIFPHLAHRMPEFNETDRNRLLRLKDELDSAGSADVYVELLRGSPKAELLGLIYSRNIPLVVMGSQGRGFVKDLFLGSVSHSIIRNSSASVLLIPADR